MPLAVSLGIGHESLVNLEGYGPKIKPENVVIIGARSLDEGERKYIKESGMKVYTMHEIDRLGMTKVIEETLDYLSACDGVHLSLDLDGLDPNDAPGVGTLSSAASATGRAIWLWKCCMTQASSPQLNSLRSTRFLIMKTRLAKQQ